MKKHNSLFLASDGVIFSTKNFAKKSPDRNKSGSGGGGGFEIWNDPWSEMMKCRLRNSFQSFERRKKSVPVETKSWLDLSSLQSRKCHLGYETNKGKWWFSLPIYQGLSSE